MLESSASRKSMFDSLQKLIYCGCVSVFSLVLLSESVGAGVNRKQLQIAQQPASNPQNPTRAEAEKLTQEGMQLFRQGTKESLLAARGKWEAALVLWQQLGGKERQAFVLVGIGRVYSDLGEKQKALQLYNQALALIRAVNNKGGEATTLNSIGGVYSDLGEKQKALQFYNQALPLYRAVDDKGGEATTLNNIGRESTTSLRRNAESHYEFV
ncbi:MAG: tetratricopeptide repeat protein, partial [Richelia sp. SM1_7_0]|nr:tetratricopeptide repeat protein [Richelia sp. SM1_7_0]